MGKRKKGVSFLIICCSLLMAFALSGYSFSKTALEPKQNNLSYKVIRFNDSMAIDANWDKAQWAGVKQMELNNFMGSIPEFKHQVYVKMMYNEGAIYVIFKVFDKHVRCLNTTINSSVWEDACVEMFFAPDIDLPLQYFNLETNCGGAVLMRYNVSKEKKTTLLKEDIQKIEIAHSMPGIVDPEITEPVTWTLEYRIPINLLKKYASVSTPVRGVRWKANFYKIAHKSSHPHYITWSLIGTKQVDFHQPRYFGNLIFQ